MPWGYCCMINAVYTYRKYLTNIMLFCVPAQPVLLKQKKIPKIAYEGESIVLSCNPPQSSTPPNIHWMDQSESVFHFVQFIWQSGRYFVSGSHPVCLSPCMCHSSWEACWSDLQHFTALQSISTQANECRTIREWTSLFFFLFIFFTAVCLVLILAHCRNKNLSSFVLYLLTLCLNFPGCVLFTSEMVHIKQSDRVMVGLDGKLYFANLLKSDSKEDYVCNAQYAEARTILPDTVVTLKVMNSEYTHTDTHRFIKGLTQMQMIWQYGRSQTERKLE